jgi:alkylation response protein AidB-like acyl-CoA dehydrogenase
MRDPEGDAAADLREFLAREAPGGVYPADFGSRLARAGYVAPHWPRPWGRDATPAEQLAIDEVLREHKVPRPMNPIGIGWAGPTLLVAGSDESCGASCSASRVPGAISRRCRRAPFVTATSSW